MTERLQILSAAEVNASLIKAWPLVRDQLLVAAAAAYERYVISATPLQRSRRSSTLGTMPADDFWRATPPQLSAPDASALSAWLDDPSEQGSRRLLLERFSKFGLVSGADDEATANPAAAIAAGRALKHPDVLWIDSLVGEADASAAWLGLDRWAEELTVATGTLLAVELPIRLRRGWLTHWPLADARSLAARASEVRASLWAALDEERSVPVELRDADPDAPLGWTGAMPGLLFNDSALLLSLSCGPEARLRDRIVAGVATMERSAIPLWLAHTPGGSTEHVAWWEHDDAALEGPACLARMQRRWRISDDRVADALRDAEGATDGAASWRDIIALSAATTLPAEVDRALSEETDWLSFEAPGEGVLPVIWRDAMRLHPAWDCEWATRFERLLDEATPSVDETLDAYPSPYAASATRLNTDQSPLSSYTHGLNDAIEEAYGDVFSPADPFSQR
ncbi:MAG: hypothetical protein ACI81R_001230 [Bradymonadia bacterium]